MKHAHELEAPEQAAMKWEYFSEVLAYEGESFMPPHVSFSRPGKPAEFGVPLTECLDTMGREEWELVVGRPMEGSMLMIFKRPAR